MIENLKFKQTLKAAELQDGDIVCFQKTTEKKGDKNILEKKFGLGENKASTEEMLVQASPASEALADGTSTRKSDRFEDAKEYYDFLHNKRVVQFRPHSTRCDATLYPPFELVLNSKIYYDGLADRVGEHLGVDPTHLRFWTVNSSSGNPKTTVKRGLNQNLQMILNPTGYSPLNSAQRSDAFYFEVLDISLAELDTKKNIKLTWLSEGISKEVRISRVARP